MPTELNSPWQGRHLSLVVQDGWEYVVRKTPHAAVAIVALTDDRRVVLVEQFRPPVGRTVIELPAGLAGDVAGCEDEPLVDAARRELLEETGYEAACWSELTRGFSSPGLTDEAVVLFLATELKKTTAGGGVDHEQITIHELPLDDALRWLAEQGKHTDFKTLAGLYAASAYFDLREAE